MRYISHCDNCGSEDFSTWSASVAANRLHFSQCKCNCCGLVFSNPQADVATLENYYSSSYWEDKWPQALRSDQESVAQAVAYQDREVQRLMQYAKGGRVLEVGSGTGGFLSAARNRGFEPYGVELSTSGVEHSRQVHGLTNIIQGTVEEGKFESSSFDVVFTWHVIEHVLDLDGFVREIHRVLRPGGLLWIGTENYQNATHYLDKMGRLIKGCAPPFATSSEHTFVFTRKTLSDVLRRRGFEVISCEAYQPTLREKLENMRFRSIFSRSYFLSQHLMNVVFHTGPLLRLAARRK